MAGLCIKPYRAYLKKKAFWPDLGVDQSFKILDTLPV